MKLYYIYIVLIIFSIVTLTSCEKMDTEDFQTTQQEYFYEFIEIENSLEQYSINDTIWISADIDDVLIDMNSGHSINLENQTYILTSDINLLMPQFDTLSFLNHNFDIIEDIGEIQIMNVLNGTSSSPPSFSFDIKFGKPINSNKVRFGIIANYPGVLAIEFEGLVYYGSERDDYDDFSLDNHKGYLDLSFSNEAINDSVYYKLPSKYRNSYDNYYNSTMISANQFFFIDVVGE